MLLYSVSLPNLILHHVLSGLQLLKGLLSEGYCCFRRILNWSNFLLPLVITYARNAPVEFWRRYQTISPGSTNHVSFSVNFCQYRVRAIFAWPFVFPNMEKALFDWPIVLQHDVKAKYRLISRKLFWQKVFFQLSVRLTNQKPSAFVSVR